MFSLNSANSVTKICHSVKGFEPLPPSHLLRKRPGCYHSTSITRVRDRNFKLQTFRHFLLDCMAWLITYTGHSHIMFVHADNKEVSFKPALLDPNRVFHKLDESANNGNNGIFFFTA